MSSAAKKSYDHRFKFILVGPSGVGKSSILLQFTDQRFDPSHDMTIGVEFGARMMTIGDQIIKIQIWDTAGQESFKSITRSYYHGALAALLVYDITSRESFRYLQGWLEDIHQNAGRDMVIVLMGNKGDMTDRREITVEEGQQFAVDNKLDYFIEVSAKTGNKIEEAFKVTAEKILQRVEQGDIRNERTDAIKLKPDPTSPQKQAPGPKNGDKGPCCG